MAFVKTTWVDRVTAVSAAQLNRIEQGIADATAGLLDQLQGVDATSYSAGHRAVMLGQSGALRVAIGWSQTSTTPRLVLWTNYNPATGLLVDITKPAWRLKLHDGNNDQLIVERAVATAGVPAWVAVATISSTGLTTLAGGVVAQAVGGFRAFRSGASIGIAQSGVVPFDSKAAPAGFDISGWYDAALFRYTPQLAGYYNLRAAVAFTTGTYAADTIFQLALRKNGTPIAWGPSYALRGATNPTMAVADLVVANGTTDYFDIIAWTSTGVGPTIVTGAVNTYFSGEYEGTA